MTRITLLHTVQTVLQNFPNLLQEVVKEPLTIHNFLDEFLASNSAEIGYFSLENRNRLYNNLKSCELTGAEMIVVTCSTLTPTVEQIRPFIGVPVIAIDDAMTEEAVRIGSKIKVVATAVSTVGPIIDKLKVDATKAGKKIKVDGQSNEPAFVAMQAGDMETHDALVLEMIKAVVGYDVIILAQASMAHLQEQAQEISGIPTLASPKLCCEQVKRILQGARDA